jgi:hypothetical protein
MRNLPSLLSNATPLVSGFFDAMLKNDVLLLTLKTTFRFRQNLQTFTVIVSNSYPRISVK